jgi:hypothetical protein
VDKLKSKQTNKKEVPLKVKGTLEELIKVAVSGNPKPKTKVKKKGR